MRATRQRDLAALAALRRSDVSPDDVSTDYEAVSPRYVVLDNMAAAVVRAHPTSPDLNRSFVEYAQSRGFFVDPARVRRPQDKPRVEN